MLLSEQSQAQKWGILSYTHLLSQISSYSSSKVDDYDTVYIAHCYPYTYSRLQNFLKEVETDPRRKHLVQRKTLCPSIAGNNCDYLIISDFNNGKEKKGVFLTSRVHPGEPMSSYVIEYIIEYLLSNSNIAKILRENFIFKIVPMLNPDGVIIGNYRCNLNLVDLNRQWIDPNKKFHPTIYHAKQLIKRMKEERDLLLYCDFHGHSRKKNCFMYGCNKDASKKEQIFPAIVKTNCNTFSFKDCCFQIQKDREGASRVFFILYRLPFGRSLTSPTASLFKSPSADQIQENMNLDTSTSPTIGIWLTSFASLFMTSQTLNQLRWHRP